MHVVCFPIALVKISPPQQCYSAAMSLPFFDTPLALVVMLILAELFRPPHHLDAIESRCGVVIEVAKCFSHLYAPRVGAASALFHLSVVPL